jgi:hypothetical protein
MVETNQGADGDEQ